MCTAAPHSLLSLAIILRSSWKTRIIFWSTSILKKTLFRAWVVVSKDVRWYSTAKADGWAAEEGGGQQEGPSYPDHWRYQGIQCHFFIFMIWWKRSWILQRFVQEHSGEDFLLHGFQGKNANPYRSLHLESFYYPYEKNYMTIFSREKSSCLVL